MNKKTLAFTFGSAIATALVINPIAHANENPFALKTVSDASMLAEADNMSSGSEKMKEGKCGEGKCGAGKKMKEDKSDMPSDEQKMKEGSNDDKMKNEGTEEK